MRGKRRAIGEIVAAVILILVASITGVLLFTTSIRASNEQSKILTTQIQREGESSQERFRILYAVKDGNNIHLWALNYGVIETQIIGAYVNGDKTTILEGEGTTIGTGSLMKITLEIPVGEPGPNYRIVVISERGVKHASDWTI